MTDPRAPRPPKVEPTSAERTMAATMYRITVALVDAGFTRGEALQVVGGMLAAAVPKPPGAGS